MALNKEKKAELVKKFGKNLVIFDGEIINSP